MRPSTRAATRDRMISIMALVLVIGIGFLVPKAAAQSDKYSKRFEFTMSFLRNCWQSKF
jgi:hypothetical protein